MSRRIHRRVTHLKAAAHETRCRECRVTWKSWAQRLLGIRSGYTPTPRKVAQPSEHENCPESCLAKQIGEHMEQVRQKVRVCAVVANCGPVGEPLACGFIADHHGEHSWASLPTWMSEAQLLTDVAEALEREVIIATAQRVSLSHSEAETLAERLLPFLPFKALS